MSEVQTSATVETAKKPVVELQHRHHHDESTGKDHPLTMSREMKFSFRTIVVDGPQVKEPVTGAPATKDDKKSAAAKKDIYVIKRPSLELVLPVPTPYGIHRALQDDKCRDWLVNVVADQIRDAAIWQIAPDEGTAVNSQEALDYNKLTIEYLANLPPSERGVGIRKEKWELWEADYKAVMPAVTGKNEKQIQTALDLFLKRLQPCRGNKKVLAALKEQLSLWIANSQNAEEFGDIALYLDGKLDAFMSADEEALLANL
jgi:hypothetical protein